jgi:threonine/homoserine/homoserine lactone efflux protein
MVTGIQLWSYALVSAVLIAVPGPSVLFAIGRALSQGRASALATVVGNACGVYVVAALIAVGLGSLVARSDSLFMVVKYIGAAYLVYLGTQAVRHRHRLALAMQSQSMDISRRRSARQGFLVGLTNPKALIMFGAVLPQFVDRSAGHVPVQMLELAFVSFAIALVSDSIWVLSAAGFRRWFVRSPRRLAAIGGAGGLAIIAVGVSVAATGRKD